MQLIVTAGVDRTRVFALSEGESLLVGRGSDSNVKLQDPRVSRKHCTIRAESGKVTAIDCGSVGGTFVNNQPVKEQVLHPGDIVRVGDTEFRIEFDHGGDATTHAGAVAPKANIAGVDDLSHLVGTTLYHYQIEKVLAKGNSGTVFLTKHTESNRPAALKVLWPSISRNEEEMQRFVRAMKTMLPIQHPNIVRLFNAGKEGQYYWLSMEYVEGESAAQVIKRIGTAGMLDWQTAYRVAVHVARALEAAAEHHIVHRNISPDNILIRASDKLTKLGDLMIAKAFEGSQREQITGPGSLVGNLSYMSPEATHGTADLDARSDIYSLGATVYALLTGRPPFASHSIVDLISKIRDEAPVAPKRYQLSVNDMFEGIVLKMLAKRPDDRFQNPTLLLKDLDRVGKYQGITV